MAEPFLSEIRMWGFSWPPRGWQQCDGQQMPITQNEALFSLIGTAYGGNGTTTFGLPDLRGRAPIHAEGGQTRMGETSGLENVTLNMSEMPTHTHALRGTTANANVNNFSSKVLASGYQYVGRESRQGPKNMYAPPENLTALSSQSISVMGGNQAHNNIQPTLVVNFCIAVTGLFPSRN
ncbi:phage tail protein [Aliikangiella sp. G2MR2-5]|uniref:phage tail protein n=1 Tax=Aliikangiella sp. G2MR2-5 TaxID=2788943 RepID=UPI0018AB3525|nr:tail fiber protein [Aliikangiella sp. G2MR2-5]